MRKSLPLALAATLTFASSAVAAERKVSHAFDSSLAAANIRRIVVEIPVGEVTVKTGSSSEIRVEGMATREADESERKTRAAQSLVDNSSVVIKSRGKIAYIEPLYRGDAGGWVKRKKTQFRVTVTVPAGLPVDIDQNVGEVAVAGATGDLNLRLGVGEVRVTMPKAAVRELSASASVGEVKTNFPDRTITKEGFFAGTTHYLNEGGRSNVNLRLRVGEMHIDLTD